MPHSLAQAVPQETLSGQKIDYVLIGSCTNSLLEDIAEVAAIPTRYKHMYTEPAQLVLHLFENRFPEFVSTLQPGDVIVCNGIFDIGSSKEQAVSTLLAVGIPMVAVPSFRRVFIHHPNKCWMVSAQVNDSITFLINRPKPHQPKRSSRG
nr:hypothetical protein [Photorhabdus caribbeanensis]